VDDHDVERALLSRGEHILQARPVEGLAGDAGVVTPAESVNPGGLPLRLEGPSYGWLLDRAIASTTTPPLRITTSWVPHPGMHEEG
jgi:hypothetical protein